MISRSRQSSLSNVSDSSQPFEDALEGPASNRFTPEEEARLVAESKTIKDDANMRFAHGDYSQAISTYDRALAVCPNYLDYDIAVLKSNIAACHVKLEDWNAAVESATQGLASLDKAAGISSDAEKPADPTGPAGSNDDSSNADGDGRKADEQVVELDAGGDEEAQLARIRLGDAERERIGRLRTKLLLRRARANQEQGGWATLAAAEADYRSLAAPDNSARLPERDARFVAAQLGALPARVKEAQEREVGEMMGKLKDLGNTFLRPFGLSTDNFKMVKDEKTGGYSMNFEGGK